MPNWGKVKISSFFRACLCAATLILLHDNAVAETDGLRPYLSGIKTIVYYVYVEHTVGGDECKIDYEKLTTSLQFIANQTTKLHIITKQREDNEAAEALRMEKRPVTPAEEGAATKRFDDFMPAFYISIFPIQHANGCSGEVEAQLLVGLKPTTIIATGTRVAFPTMEVWSGSYGLLSSRQNFSDKAIGIAEQLMKQFVNDWAASQTEYPDVAGTAR